MARRPRTPKLKLAPPERAALRAAHVSNLDLVRFTPRELSKATKGRVPVDRARELCALAQFQQLPWIGPSIATDLLRLGLLNLLQVAQADPDALLRKLEKQAGKQDPCVGDVLHSAVWHAKNPKATERPWWEWSQQRLAAKPAPRRKGGSRR